MHEIHPTAVIESGATVGAGCSIGPFCVVGADVVLEERVRLVSHVVVAGVTRVGSGTVIYPFASIGQPPQDLKFKGERSSLIIGQDNVIREHVTMNTGTAGGGMVTKVGSRCLFMASCHVAHDCELGDNVILANNATLAGHVRVGDFAFLGGLSAVHQFVRIGPQAMIGGVTGVERDVIPFGMVTGDRAELVGLNLVGLKRRGFTREDIDALRQCYEDLFHGSGTFADRMSALARQHAGNPAVDELIAFVTGESSRGLCQPRARNAG